MAQLVQKTNREELVDMKWEPSQIVEYLFEVSIQLNGLLLD